MQIYAFFKQKQKYWVEKKQWSKLKEAIASGSEIFMLHALYNF